jgi:hypothetical protein
MKKVVAAVAMMSVMAVAGMAEASLSTIGTADYAGSSYNLIYDNDSSLIWLDYSNAGNTWNNQVAWASNLGSTLSNVKLNTGVSVNWNGGWRLPTTVDGTTAVGYNITSSEFGHLYYTELQNKGFRDTNGNIQAGWGLTNNGPFANLQLSAYWSGTAYAALPFDAYIFDFSNGLQTTTNKSNSSGYILGMAVSSAIVTQDATPTPIPAAAWLLGSGLMGLFGSRRKKA